MNAFRLLGEDWELNAEVTVAWKSFVCRLYRYKDTDIHKVRKKIFDKKFLLGRKVMGLSLLPPCKSTYLHILHSNYVASNLKFYLLNVVKRQSIMGNGWIENSEIVSVDDAFPDDIMEILVDEDFDEGSMEPKLYPQDDSNAENIDN